MVKIIYWGIPILPELGSIIGKAPGLCAGVICGIAQAVGMEIFTKDTLNEAITLKTAADVCKDELPLIGPDHDEISSIMTEGGKTAISKAKAIMKSSGVDEKCLEIFSLVCNKAQESGALDIVKEACMNLWL